MKSRTPAPRLVLRAQIVLLAGESLPNAEIAGQLGVNIHTVRLWRNRYIAEGFKGLLEDRVRGRDHGGKNTVGQEAAIVSWSGWVSAVMKRKATEPYVACSSLRLENTPVA